MTDDAVGLEALQALEQAYELPAGVDTLDGGTLGLDLLVHLEGYPRVLIADCVLTGRAPGTVVRIERDDVPAAFADALSPHQVGLQDLMAVLELQGRLPEHLTVVGVEPESLELGLELSEPVRRSLPRVVQALADELARWGLAPRRRAP
ncbi:MAG: HyaD/HybD family hydrogenase maturation endopeptidase [Deferrisomatales bacterium]